MSLDQRADLIAAALEAASAAEAEATVAAVDRELHRHQRHVNRLVTTLATKLALVVSPSDLAQAPTERFPARLVNPYLPVAGDPVYELVHGIYLYVPHDVPQSQTMLYAIGPGNGFKPIGDRADLGRFLVSERQGVAQ
jgi:hypothetical protein